MRMNGIAGFNKFNQPAFNAKINKNTLKKECTVKDGQVIGAGINAKLGDKVTVSDNRVFVSGELITAEKKECGPCAMRSLSQNVGCGGDWTTISIKDENGEHTYNIRGCTNKGIDIYQGPTC